MVLVAGGECHTGVLAASIGAYICCCLCNGLQQWFEKFIYELGFDSVACHLYPLQAYYGGTRECAAAQPGAAGECGPGVVGLSHVNASGAGEGGLVVGMLPAVTRSAQHAWAAAAD